MLQPFLGHNHTDASNIRLRDCVIKTEELLDYAVDELGLPGLAITDHESLSNHAKAQAYITENQEKFKDFTLALGNEIYLVDRDKIDYARENNEKAKFPHFILIAKNNNGYLGLKEMSTKAWKNMFMFRGMERVPLYYDEIEEFMKKYKGDIIATTSCIGGDLPQKLIKYHDDKTTENKKDVHNFITWLIDVFGKDDLYFELQPSHSREQLVTNEMMLNVSKGYGITPIVTTDSHYLNREKANVHKIYLQASQGEREVDEFYATTYMMGSEEIHSYMDDYIGSDVVNNLIQNTHSIMNKIEDIDLFMEVQVPKAHIEDYTPINLTKEYDDKYEYIAKFRNSSSDMNRYYLYLIEKGLEFYKQELNDENLKRIDIELEQIWEVSEKLKQDLSSYFVLTKEVVDLMWQTSLVGVARGSAACYYTNYLLGIVQINPLEYDLPYWRFLSKDRPNLPKYYWASNVNVA